jgi:hypothetical protein
MYFLDDTFVAKPDNTNRNLAPIHFEVWKELQDMMVLDKYDKLELILPRGSAKTTVVNYALAVWCHCYKTSIYTIVTGRVEQDAVDFTMQIRRTLEENEKIKKFFGELIDTKENTVNKLELELTNRTKIQAISSTTSFRGKKYRNVRPTVIICDDYQGRTDVLTDEAREKKYNTFQQDCLYSGDKAVYRKGEKVKRATKFILIGTILHESCLMSRVLKDNSYKHIVKKAILVDNVDELFNEGKWLEFKTIYFNTKLDDRVSEAKEFYYQNEKEMQYPVLWEDKWDCLDTAIDYYNDPVGFKQEMQNDASKIGEKRFKTVVTESPEQINSHEFVKTILAIDPAGTARKGKKVDYYAYALGSLSNNGIKYVRKGELHNHEFDDYMATTIKFLKDYPEISHVSIEKNTYSGADIIKLKELVKNDDQLKRRNIVWINEQRTKNKDDRITTIVADVNQGRIIFNSDDQQAIQQMLDFAGCEFTVHDDFPDVMADLAQKLDSVQVMMRVKFL